jgi:hypothetical protein
MILIVCIWVISYIICGIIDCMLDEQSIYHDWGSEKALLPIVQQYLIVSYIMNRYDIKITSYQRLSEEAKRSINATKEHRDKEIARIKAECKHEIDAIRKEDKQEELLNKLGLTREDLEMIKSMKETVV